MQDTKTTSPSDYTPNPDIIDNDSVHFDQTIHEFLKHGMEANFATGYFYLNGFKLLKDDLKDLKVINILMSPKTNRTTYEEIAAGYDAKQEITNDLHKDSQNLSEGSPQLKSLVELRDLIKEGKVNFRVYTKCDKNIFHSKLYIIFRDDAVTPQIAIIGSSNFTEPGMRGNTELNYVIKDYATTKDLNKWFMRMFNQAEEFNKDLITIIESSPAIKKHQAAQIDPDYIAPFELYKYIIYRYLNEDITVYESVLAEFQKLGVENAKEKIRKYNGVIVSDSVGLGKSFIGGELIKWYRDQNKRILLIVPASLIEQWRNLLETDGISEEQPYFGLSVDDIGIKIISDTKFSNHLENEILKEYGNFDVVLVDEAHNFRNSEPNRYTNIQKLKGRTFILLTATPLNNTIRDLKNLVNIFTNQITLRNEHLDFNAFDEYYKLSKNAIGKTTSPEDTVKLDETIQKIGRILDEVMILRTRKIIKEKYPNLDIHGKNLEFPTPKIYPMEYRLSSSYEPIYQNIDTFISSLKLPHLYIVNQSNGKTLEGLFKVLLLKRLESSVYSFIKSLNRIVEKETNLKEDINKLGFNTAISLRKNDLEKIDEQISADIDLSAFIDENVSDGKFEDMTESEVLNAIEFDINTITEFLKTFLLKVKRSDGEYDFDDDKLDRIIRILLQNRNDKILIFTQFRTTAEYLYYHLKDIDTSRNVKMVVGGETSPSGRKVQYKEDGKIKERSLSLRDLKVRLFSPKSYNFKLELNEREIDILISTDTLSEGVNLQDCSLIINYDLPWNPTKIMQRVGRVDRIGNKNQVTVYNFFPDKGIESLLKLLEKLQNKIKNIATIIGKENGILHGEENINIKTIGEKITEMRSFTDIIEFEDKTKNPIFGNIGDEREAQIRFRLRSNIKELGLSRSDFKEYGNVPYSISGTGKKGLFSMYRIYDTKDGHKFKDVLLFYDTDSKKVSEITPLDIQIMPGTPGHTRLAGNETIDIEPGMKQITEQFEEMFFTLKSGYSDVEMITGFKMTTIQDKVIKRLNDILNPKQRSLNEDIQRQKSTLYELKNVYRNVFLSQSDATKLNKMFEKGVFITDVEIFIKILKEFRKEVINKNPDYQKSLRSEKNIEYKQICWGAFT